MQDLPHDETTYLNRPEPGGDAHTSEQKVCTLSLHASIMSRRFRSDAALILTLDAPAPKNCRRRQRSISDDCTKWAHHCQDLI